MKTAYEKWLILRVKNEIEPLTALSEMLWEECYKRNEKAFELVEKVGDKQWSMYTFQKAALMILNDES
jgi:hypothetical protein